MTTTVFVYGTLMPGERNAHIAARGGPFTAQPATLRAHRLHHLHPEAYPALTPGHPDDLVRGYALTYTPDAWSAALPFLDELEGIHDSPPLYTRGTVTLELEGGAALPAWVYLYARPERLSAAGAQHVPGGDWRVVEGRMHGGA